MPEMNLPSGQVYDIGTSGNSYNSFILAWRHAYAIIREYNGSHAMFVFSPDGANSARFNLASFFPGTGYVQYMGLDMYDWASSGRSIWGYAARWFAAERALAPRVAEGLTECGTLAAPKGPDLQNAITNAEKAGLVFAVYYDQETTALGGVQRWALTESAASYEVAAVKGLR
jgi:hypothetical protein